MRILVVEDDHDLAGAITQGLRGKGFAVDVAEDGEQALEKVASNEYDVVLLDRDLPRVHGDDVCRRLVSMQRAPRVLMLTASAGLEQRVHGFQIGADDYLPKPFAFDELIARIQALGRRPARTLPPIVKLDDLTVDVPRHRVERAGAEIRLTAKEFAVLEILVSADGAVVSAEELLERAWDENVDPFTATVRVIIANLRHKLGSPPLIETIIGAGYRVVASPR